MVFHKNFGIADIVVLMVSHQNYEKDSNIRDWIVVENGMIIQLCKNIVIRSYTLIVNGITLDLELCTRVSQK